MDAESVARLLPPITRSLVGVALIGFVLMLLHLATPILTPILFAFFLVAMAISPFRWLLARGVRRGLALLLMLTVLLVGGVALVMLALVSVRSLQASLSVYGEQIAARMTELTAALTPLGLELGGSETQFTTFGVSLMGGFLGALADIAGMALISLVLVAFFLLELDRFIAVMRSERVRREPIVGQIPAVAQTAVRYFGIRTRLNLITGAAVTLICLLVGVDYALLWGVTAFFLSYIPYIGLLTAMIPPALLALAEFGWPQALLIIIAIVLINLLIENVVEPGYTGKRLQLSPTVVFLSFFIWAWLLGPVGALLSMPITVMLLLVFQSNENTLWLARIIGYGTSDELPLPDAGARGDHTG
jgi:predicted PurR-regulated permease PerM